MFPNLPTVFDGLDRASASTFRFKKEIKDWGRLCSFFFVSDVQSAQELCRLDCDCLDLDQVCSGAHILLQRHPDAKPGQVLRGASRGDLGGNWRPGAGSTSWRSLPRTMASLTLPGSWWRRCGFCERRMRPPTTRRCRCSGLGSLEPHCRRTCTSSRSGRFQRRWRRLSHRRRDHCELGARRSRPLWPSQGIQGLAGDRTAAPFPIAEKQHRTKEELYRSLRHAYPTLLWDARDPDWFEDKLRRVQLAGRLLVRMLYRSHENWEIVLLLLKDAALFGCQFWGRRYLMIPELDHKTKVQSTTFKDFRDPASTVSARTLYGDIVPFKVSWGMVLCTNTKVSFTTDVTEDGGVERSVAVVRWPFRLRPSHLDSPSQIFLPSLIFLPSQFFLNQCFGGRSTAPGKALHWPLMSAQWTRLSRARRWPRRWRRGCATCSFRRGVLVGCCFFHFAPLPCQVFKVFGDVAGRGWAVDTPYAVVRDSSTRPLMCPRPRFSCGPTPSSQTRPNRSGATPSLPTSTAAGTS